MRHLSTTLVAFVMATLAATVVHAHDGHGPLADQGHTPAHYVTEPVHLLPLLGLATVAAAVIYGLLRLNRYRQHGRVTERVG